MNLFYFLEAANIETIRNFELKDKKKALSYDKAFKKGGRLLTLPES